MSGCNGWYRQGQHINNKLKNLFFLLLTWDSFLYILEVIIRILKILFSNISFGLCIDFPS